MIHFFWSIQNSSKWSVGVFFVVTRNSGQKGCSSAAWILSFDGQFVGFPWGFHHKKRWNARKIRLKRGGCSRFSCSWRVGWHSGRVFKNQAIGFHRAFLWPNGSFVYGKFQHKKTLPACKKYKVACISAKYFLLPTRSRVAQVAGRGGSIGDISSTVRNVSVTTWFVVTSIYISVLNLNRKHRHLTSDEV